MILIKRASWSASRLVGIVLFWIASTSLIGWYADYRLGILNSGLHNIIGVLDIFGLLKVFLGSAPAFIALIVLWFVALYLSLRISYRAILSRVRESVPSLRNMRDVLIPSDDDEDIIPAKRGRADDEYKKKAEELERKLTAIQNKKTPEVIEKPKNNTNALMGAL